MDQRLPRILAILVGVAAVAVVLALVLGGGDDDSDDEAAATDHPVKAVAKTQVISPTGLVMRVVGEVKGEPMGTMSVLITRHIPQAPKPGGEPIPLDLDMVWSQPGGSFDAKLTGTVQITRTGQELVNGHAPVSHGVGRYEGVTGAFDLKGRNDPGAIASAFAVTGDLKY